MTTNQEKTMDTIVKMTEKKTEEYVQLFKTEVYSRKKELPGILRSWYWQDVAFGWGIAKGMTPELACAFAYHFVFVLGNLDR
jgi:hypothetical protein